jgi:DNA-binding transcriptional MerR regulator
MPGSKDGENPSTSSIIRKRLQQGVSVADIKRAASYVPLDNDKNPSFALRDSLDAAIDKLLREREKAEATQKLIVQTMERERAAAESELADLARQQELENSLIEDELPA